MTDGTVSSPKPHWLAPAGKTKSPDVVISFDTETTELEHATHSAMTLRCWDAKVRRRHQPNGRRDLTAYYSGERPAQLAGLVSSLAEPGVETWVVAHNVSFDLAVTSLPFVLVSMGWTLEAFNLGDESSWWVLKSDARKLVITDSWSWVRCSLKDAAKDLHRRKAKLPADTDTLATWHHRCRVDADILDQMMATIMDWWDAQQLGVFGITGAACGWRTLRKKVKAKKLLVGPEESRTDFERSAVFGGLKEVYGVGEFHDTWIADTDFVSAYTTAAAGFALPMMPTKKWSTSEKLLSRSLPPERDYVAEVEITTRVPCAPVRIAGEVWNPVGTFRTVLSGPEVRYAATKADSVTVLRHEAYRTSMALADWAGWCLAVQTAPATEVPPIVARVAKNWGRLAIGRFASRTSRILAERPATHLGWHLETGHDLDTGKRLEIISIGGVERTMIKDVDGTDVFPAVLAFIEGHCRVALRQLMDSRPSNHLLQANTDGWWEMRVNRADSTAMTGVPWPYRVTRKALERRLLVKGPNHVLSPHERRYAGIPAEAIGPENEEIHWRDWPGLRWQLEHGVTGEYHRPDRDAILAEHYVRRWVLITGETIPVTTKVDLEGITSIEPWQRSWGQRDDDVLAAYQVPTLAKLNDTDRVVESDVVVHLPIQPGRDFPSPPRGSSTPHVNSDEDLDRIDELEATEATLL